MSRCLAHESIFTCLPRSVRMLAVWAKKIMSCLLKRVKEQVQKLTSVKELQIVRS